MEDFNDSAIRHLQDAELLYGQNPQRLANASHLFGVSAECSLKAIAKHLVPTARFGGRNGHIPTLFSELQNISPAIASNASLASKIAVLQQHFASWQVSERYASQATFASNRVSQEQVGANAANLLRKNCLGGLV